MKNVISICEYLNSDIRLMDMFDYIEHIEDKAFKGTTHLKKMLLSNNLKTIGEEAFFGSAIEEISIPASVTSIGDGAFSECPNLKKVTFLGAPTLGVGVFRGSAVEEVDFKGVTIPESTFENCIQLQHFDVPEGVITLETGAFRCSGLWSITLPTTLRHIGAAVFEDCEDLFEIDLPEGLKTIGDQSFYWCQNLHGLELPEGLEYIGSLAFARSAIRKMRIPSRTRILGVSLFSGATIEELELPEEMKDIPDGLCQGCHFLKAVTFPAHTRRVGDGAFMYSGLENVELPEGTVYVGRRAFASIPAKQVSVWGPCMLTEQSFADCESLTSVTAPHVKYADETTFDGCKKLQLSGKLKHMLH